MWQVIVAVYVYVCLCVCVCVCVRERERERERERGGGGGTWGGSDLICCLPDWRLMLLYMDLYYDEAIHQKKNC